MAPIADVVEQLDPADEEDNEVEDLAATIDENTAEIRSLAGETAVLSDDIAAIKAQKYGELVSTVSITHFSLDCAFVH